MPRKDRLEGTPNSLDLTGLADDWDAVPVIRDSLRDGGRLLPESSECTVKTCGENAHVLSPILLRMAATSDKKVPDVGPLKVQLSELYTRNRLERSTEDVEVIEDGWSIRKMVGFVKMKCRRSEVSQVV